MPTYTREEIDNTFIILKANQFAVGSTNARERIEKLKKFHRIFLQYRQAIKEAMFLDFRKHAFEVDLTEIYTVTSELKHTKRNLRRWMGKHSTPTPLALIGSRSYIHYEAKGVVLIISPWNFPVTLTFGPLIAAIAAGNTVIVKPSEQTPNTALVMQQIVEEVFEPDEVVLLQGGIETSKILLSLPFNHIFFTGSSRVGKIVMESAAKHLTSVTLELGGKSPTIVDETANIDQAARTITWVKCINNGQICIAPDHVWVYEKVKEKFIISVNLYLKKYYSEDAHKEPSYARLVNENHFKKVNELFKNAIEKGAKVRAGGQSKGEENYMDPTVLTDIPEGTDIMKEEIFGPVLPVQSFQNISELITQLNKKEKPLALYIYSRNQKNIRQIIEGTRTGGTCINSCGIHFFNNNLPFGGSNFSGIGKGHGWFGFESFSNARAVYNQFMPSALEILVPPYNRFKQRIIDLAIKYL
ncbi:MAG: aldehyde dehydrogenase family protein [Saprospiraceae bacterium]|nr:aldehyde dehydrogenase family protein [Saprospiraceae bacterium]